MIRALLFAASLVLTTFSYAASVADVLSQTGQASRELSYTGIVTFEYGASIQSLRVAHGVVDGEEYEVLTALNGAPYEITRSSSAIDEINGKQSLFELIYGSTVANYSAEPVAYTAEYQGDYRIADRVVNQVVIRAKDKLRYGYIFLIDAETGLILKRITFNEEGLVLERMQFVEINYLDGVPASFARAIREQIANTADQQVQNDLVHVLKPNWLPKGFYPSGVSSDGFSDLWTFTDGLASVSVVLEPVSTRTKDLRTEGRARRGATVVYTRPVAIGGEPYVLTVLGEVPIMTAAKISRHIRLR